MYKIVPALLSFILFPLLWMTSGFEPAIAGNIRLVAEDSLTQNEMHYELKGITIKGRIPQLVQSRDTAIINTAAYHTPEGSYLKDLVKRVPGLEYDEKTGKLTFNGKSIREINVNGKTFFSGDTKTPIENLPVNLVSRLKIYKKQTDRDKALGIHTNNEFYVLDLQTKKDFNKTFMNSAVAGWGNQYKKQLELHSDYFETGGENFSIHATSGNQYINDLYKGSINNNIGINLTHEFKKGLMLTAGAQYSRNKSGNESSTYQEQYLQETSNYSINQNQSRQASRAVNGNINLNWEIDSKTQITANANYGYTENNNSTEGTNASIKSPLSNIDLQQPFNSFNPLPDSLKINKNNSRTSTKAYGNTYFVNANFIRRLNSKGSMLNLSLQNSHNYNRTRETSENSTIFYQLRNSAGKDSLFIQNLLKQSPTSSDSWTAGLSFVQPLSKKLKLQLSYNFSNSRNKDIQNTSGTSIEHSQYMPVDSLSGYSTSRTNSHDISMLLNYTSDIWNVYLTADIIPGIRSLSHHLYNEAVDTLSHVTDFRGNIHIERTKNNQTIAFDYSTSSSQPDLLSLVPLIDNSDPLNISRGNPDLKPTYTHNWNISYNSFTKGISINAGFNLSQNSITQATRYNSKTGGRETYPVNINGNWGGSIFSRWWKNSGKFNLNVMGNGLYNRNVNLLSETQEMKRNITQNILVMSNLQAGYTPSWGGINLTENYNYNYTVNSSQKDGNYTHTLSSMLMAFTDLPFGLQLQTDFMYTYRTGDNVPSKEKNQTIWNASVTYRFLKERRMELTLAWHDILNHSRMYFRTSSPTGFYESYSPQIRSYFMVTLKYRFQLLRSK